VDGKHHPPRLKDKEGLNGRPAEMFFIEQAALFLKIVIALLPVMLRIAAGLC